ncbi:MAG: NADP-dependent malic enzyme [Bdellovibrionales bacterium]|nr:NADP-dependent malic enzyme [Bdellovibrionales bacterium]
MALHMPDFRKPKSPPVETPAAKLSRAELALEYHRGSMIPAGSGSARPGKIEVVPTKSVVTQRDLSFAYSPGVAEPCKEIFRDPEQVYAYTARSNLVGVITNGTAVLGLGNIGPLAAKPVMEGKGVLFKKFADIDCFDIEIEAPTIDEFVETVARMEPTFGGINLEDVKAPECFEIERRLRERMKIPVFHDDQHGTAIISGAALLNALELTGRKIEDVRVVHCGGGAASISCARFWLSLGVKVENCIMTDRFGVIRKDRSEETNPYQMEFAWQKTAWHPTAPKTWAEAMRGADVFMGCSVSNVVTPEMLREMKPNPIVFAMANPDPEIRYEDAIASRPDILFATGRSDFPNQVNNVLGYPFIFRGALDVRASTINEAMKVAAARALAALAKQDVPESVIQAYGGTPLEYGPKYILPKPFDPRALLWVAPAVAKAAVDSKVAQLPLPGGSIESYRARLEKLLGKSRSMMADIRDRIERADEAQGIRKVRIVLPEGSNEKILKAAAEIVAQDLATPILLGDPDIIKPVIRKLGLSELESVEIIRPSRSEFYDEYCQKFWDLRKRKGLTPALAAQLIKDPLYFGAMHVREGRADAWLSGQTRTYPETIRPALQVIGSRGGQRVAGVYMLIWKDRVVFLSDTTVNIDPSAEDLAEIAINAAQVAESLGFEPRVGMLSYSNFGSSDFEEPRTVRAATRIVQRRRPDLVVDGEVQADIAVNPEVLRERYPFSSLKDQGANVLVFPNLSAANISYKLLCKLGGADPVGPILVGMNKPIHVLQLNAEVREIVNMAIIAVLDAQRSGMHRQPLVL